ncbi:MAG: hypothetical protein PWQ17_467 [Anaerophaga sp.]|nr:hypothetical protein [Anaerophaga sp.]
MNTRILFFRIRSYLKYFLFAGHRKGYGIHSPFVFFLVRELVGEKYPFYAFKRIDAARRMLLKNNTVVETDTLGAPSVSNKKQKKIKQLVSEGSLPPKFGEILFRLINYFDARNIIELGTGTGLSTLWLALPHSRSRVITIEGNARLSDIAKQLFEIVEVSNIRVWSGSFAELLPEVLDQLPRLDFVFFDGDHRKDSVLGYFETCLKKVHNNTIFVFDDIHWNKEMEEAWHIISYHPQVTVSLDFYRIGIVFFRKECTKQHYMVRF